MTPARKKLEQRRMRFAQWMEHETFHHRSWAIAFGVSIPTIYAWKKVYDTCGAEGLKSKPASGRPRRLSKEQELQVQMWLKDPGSPIGPDWTPTRVQQAMGREFGIWYHPGHISKLLHRWGWQCHVIK